MWGPHWNPFLCGPSHIGQTEPVPAGDGAQAVGFRTRGPTFASQTVQGPLTSPPCEAVWGSSPLRGSTLVLGLSVSSDPATPWTMARQAPLSTGLFRQEYWSGLPCPPPGDLPNPGIKPRSPTQQADSLLAELRWPALGEALFSPQSCLCLKICLRKALPSLLILPLWQASPANLLIYFTSFCVLWPLAH